MTVIASTTISIQLPHETKELEVRIFAPEPIENGCWKCFYEIDWPEQKRRFSGQGANSMQALVLSLQMLGGEIYASQAHKEGRLNAGEGGYGIPVPPNFRPDLLGYDAKYL